VAREQAAALQRQEDERLRFMQELQASTVEFQAELASIEVEVKKLFTYSDIDSSEEYAGAVRVIEMRLKEAKENAVLINSREKLFEFPITDFDDIGRLSKVLLPSRLDLEQYHGTANLSQSSVLIKTAHATSLCLTCHDRVQVFEPYANLWTIAAAFNRDSPNWMFGPFTQLDGDTIESNVTAWWKFAWKAEKTFEGKVKNVASNIERFFLELVVKSLSSN
jgi:hypothetical protein